MLRIFSFFIVISISIISEGYAGYAKVEILIKNESDNNTIKKNLKRKRDLQDTNRLIGITEFSSKHQKIEPLSTDTPTTKERKYFSPIRRQLALEEYKRTNGEKSAVDSPIVRKIYCDNDRGNYWEEEFVFEGRTILLVNNLFDPNAKVLKSDGTWESNLERMKRGGCPIGKKGIFEKKDLGTLRNQEIIKKQNTYRIELHHVTQKDSGTPEDPICEVTHAAHMGENARMILEFNSTSKEVSVVHSSLEKDKADELFCKKNQHIVTNVLHFREGNSLIVRKEFNAFREKYWKNRAAGIETPSLSKYPEANTVKKRLF